MAGTAIAAAMVLTAVVALGCTLADRPRRLRSVLASVVMFVAMADMALGHRLLGATGWALLLITLAVFLVARPRSRDDHCGWRHSLALVAAALIMITAPHGRTTPGATEHGGHPVLEMTLPHHGWLISLVIIGVYVVVVSRPLLRAAIPAPGGTAPGGTAPGGTTPRRAPLMGIAATAGCLGLMAALPLIG